MVEVEFPGVQGLTNRPLVEEQHPRVTSNLKFEKQLYNLFLQTGAYTPTCESKTQGMYFSFRDLTVERQYNFVKIGVKRVRLGGFGKYVIEIDTSSPFQALPRPQSTNQPP